MVVNASNREKIVDWIDKHMSQCEPVSRQRIVADDTYRQRR